MCVELRRHDPGRYLFSLITALLCNLEHVASAAENELPPPPNDVARHLAMAGAADHAGVIVVAAAGGE